MSIFFIRKLYPPIDHYYFLMRLSDWNKIYRPISLALFDVTTALSFFGEHKKTRELIELEVAKCVEQWNTTYGSLPLVRHIPYNLANNIFMCVCVYKYTSNGFFFHSLGRTLVNVSSHKTICL